jgi:carbon storage regulator
MLVLSRKKNESIVIDDRIVITIVEIRGDKVRLGIEAPRDVSVHRSEVFEAIRAEQAAHAAPAPVSPATAAAPVEAAQPVSIEG